MPIFNSMNFIDFYIVWIVALHNAGKFFYIATVKVTYFAI
ncbi:hypothetical protein P3J6_110389 [Pseudoalteromonas sp. 3J6]|nr:hypothetical protein P3J6_110389 [Pseudoalteromonas sp. 3J6]